MHALFHHPSRHACLTAIHQGKGTARLDRDELLHVLNTRRSAIQHAADSVWPYSEEINRPVRKTFGLPLTRPMGM